MANGEILLEEYSQEIDKANEFIRDYGLAQAALYAAELPAGSWQAQVWTMAVANHRGGQVRQHSRT